MVHQVVAQAVCENRLQTGQGSLLAVIVIAELALPYRRSHVLKGEAQRVHTQRDSTARLS